MVESIIYSNKKLKILNQLKLPVHFDYEPIDNVTDAWNAIHSMKVRGAPAIAILAVLSIAVDINDPNVSGQLNEEKDKLLSRVRHQCQYLCTSRPTAVNITKECDQLIVFAQQLAEDSNVSFATMTERLTKYANNLLEIDINTNKAIGDFGAKHIIALNAETQAKNILTHCNTGSLATGLTHLMFAPL